MRKVHALVADKNLEVPPLKKMLARKLPNTSQRFPNWKVGVRVIAPVQAVHVVQGFANQWLVTDDVTLGKPSVLAVQVRNWLQLDDSVLPCTATHDTARQAHD